LADAFISLPSLFVAAGWSFRLREFEPKTFRSRYHANCQQGIIAVMDGLEIESFSVVGHDWGCQISECLSR